MRTTLVAFAALAACKSPKAAPDGQVHDAPGDGVVVVDAPHDMTLPLDAPMGYDAPDAAVALCTPRLGTNVVLEPVVSGLNAPLAVTSPDGDSRLFVIEQEGRIKIIENGAVLPTPYLDLTLGVLDGGERGLLGLAFHPDFRFNGRFYVNFTRTPDGDTVIAEFTANPASSTADPSSRRDVLVIDQPYSNHNAGWLEFGPDRMLYIAMGDGGSGGDPQDRAQNDASMLGKLLRIDVDTRTGAKAYGIPADNPFVTSADGASDPRPESWGKGLRNPFRFSFDRGTGDLYIGDVGQGAWEEVNAGPNVAGINWGWDDREGAHCYEPMTGCLTAGRTDPVAEHSASTNWHSVIGGQVYRGSCFPDLVGTYFYGDYVAAELWAFELSGGQAMNRRRIMQSTGNITSIHADALGELYVVTHGGAVRRITVSP